MSRKSSRITGVVGYNNLHVALIRLLVLFAASSRQRRNSSVKIYTHGYTRCQKHVLCHISYFSTRVRCTADATSRSRQAGVPGPAWRERRDIKINVFTIRKLRGCLRPPSFRRPPLEQLPRPHLCPYLRALE